MRAIDCWVNVTMGDMGRPDFMVRVSQDYFKNTDNFFTSFSIDELIALMDRLEVERALLAIDAEQPSDDVLGFCAAHPERFSLAPSLDPRRGMKPLRALESLVQHHPVAIARVVPFLINLPPNDRVYYPLYTRCIDLDLPVSINTGIPGPPMPGKVQDPMYLDDVCLFFPELKIVMAHGADPWWNVAIRLMLKYENLYLMTSAYAPKYFPPELIHFMNTRGKHKILFATDHPVLPLERALSEAKALDLRPGVLEKYLYENARRVLFPDGK